jgi:hypothetical protein
VTDAELERELGGGGPARPAKAPASVYVPPAAGEPELPAGLSPAQINQAVSARVSSLKGCIAEQRSTGHAANGTLKLRWVIGGDGSVRDVQNLSSDLEGQPIAGCIREVVQGIRFPATRTRGQEVVFPFKF